VVWHGIGWHGMALDGIIYKCIAISYLHKNVKHINKSLDHILDQFEKVFLMKQKGKD
jgi:hypothetical protein